MSAAQDVLRRIGGPHCVSWFAFWVTFALNGLNHLVGSPWLHGHWELRLTAVVLSQAAMFAVLLVARVTYLRHAGTSPRPMVTLVTFALAGATKSVVLLTFLGQFLPVPRYQVIASLITGTFMFGAYLAACGYLVAVYSENRQRLAEATRAQAALVSARAEAQIVLRERRREATEMVEADLLAALDAMAAAGQPVDAQQLQAFLDQTVRPTSHRLASGIQRWEPSQGSTIDTRLRWNRLFGAVGMSHPFAPGVQATLSVAQALATIAVLSPSRFVVLLTAALVVPLVVLTAANRSLDRLSLNTPVLIAAVLGWCLLTAGALAACWGAVLAGIGLAHIGVAYAALITVVLALASVAAKAALTAQRTLQQDLASAQAQLRWDVARVHQLQWRQQRLSARALHGPVQVAILTEALRLDSTGQHTTIDDVREDVTSALNRSITETDVPPLADLLELLDLTWGPLSELTFHIDPQANCVDADTFGRSCLADILTEAVANAVRHGFARRVEIRIDQLSPRLLRVQIRDDGQCTGTAPGSGLGSQIMDDCCVWWERVGDQTGTTVRFDMPFEPRSEPACAATSAKTDRSVPGLTNRRKRQTVT